MEVEFLGVGEACDPANPNTSLLVSAESRAKKHYILLDCGFTTPQRFFHKSLDPNDLEGLWISHFHGDHFFGIPLLLLRFWEMERRAPLIIIGQQGVQQKVEAALDLAYPGFGKRLQFSVQYHEVQCGAALDACGFTMRFAGSMHSAPCLAVKISDADRSLFYSGDGQPTAKSQILASGCDLVVHEAYRFAGQTRNHGSVDWAIDFAGQASARRLALVHLAHYEREACRQNLAVLQRQAPWLEILLPESGDVVKI